MLYVMRLAKGDCIIADCSDEQSARELANVLAAEDGETLVSVRELGRFGVRLSPNDEGSLEVHSWDDPTLDDILVNEYPLLNEAFRAANALSLVPNARSDEPLIAQLKQAHEQNTEIIRKGLQQERERFSSEANLQDRKAAHHR